MTITTPAEGLGSSPGNGTGAGGIQTENSKDWSPENSGKEAQDETGEAGPSRPQLGMWLSSNCEK